MKEIEMSYLNQCPDCGSDIRFQASGILKGAYNGKV